MKKFLLGHLEVVCQVPKALGVSRGAGGDVTAQGHVTAQLCPRSGGHARNGVVCWLPHDDLVARDGRWHQQRGWGQRSAPLSAGRVVVWSTLMGPRGFPGWGDPAAPGAPQGSTHQRSDAVAKRGGGWWRQVGGCPLGFEDLGVEIAATGSHLQSCAGERERRWAGGSLEGYPPSQPPLADVPQLCIRHVGSGGWALLMG